MHALSPPTPINLPTQVYARELLEETGRRGLPTKPLQLAINQRQSELVPSM